LIVNLLDIRDRVNISPSTGKMRMLEYRHNMADMNWCEHIGAVLTVEPSGEGCEECLKTGDQWVHLRLCRSCGHIGCCDSSVNRHASAHFNAAHHPIISSFEPGENWGYCYIDDMFFQSLPESGTPA